MLLIDIIGSTVITHDGLLDEELEEAVHLVGLSAEVIVVSRLKLKRRDEPLLQFFLVQEVGFSLYGSLVSSLLISMRSTVAVLDSAAYFRLHLTTFLAEQGVGFGKGIALAANLREPGQPIPDRDGIIYVPVCYNSLL